MNYDKNKAHYVVATGIVIKEGKFLIVKRADWEKNSPGKWTVPGGKLEVLDYILKQTDTKDGKQWYNIIETLVKREIKEEAGIEINNIGYVTSLAFVRTDGIPTLVISLYADYSSGEIKLCSALSEFAWVSLEEAKKYDLIEGIYHELEILDNFLRTGKHMAWEKP
ncbi:NUDIX domain-containing protein [Candidatus Pacearchaeota archaeon]|nr:NUDIX domain-containing protein [Candidatus Pacearchaeota archaeon]